jgi:hypothetical protein
VALSTRRLHAVPGLALARNLANELRAFGYELRAFGYELRAFGYELSATGKPRYEGRGTHDDLVLALALAVWASEHGGGSGEAFREMMAAQVASRRASP